MRIHQSATNHFSGGKGVGVRDLGEINKKTLFKYKNSISQYS